MSDWRFEQTVPRYDHEGTLRSITAVWRNLLTGETREVTFAGRDLFYIRELRA